MKPPSLLAAVALAAWAFGACTMDASLGKHEPQVEPITRSAANPQNEADEPTPETVNEDAGEGAAGANEAADLPPTAEEEATPPPEEATDAGGPLTEENATLDAADAGAHSGDAHEPVTDAGVVEQQTPICDDPTDNACVACQQEACCEQRVRCLQSEACACHLHCRQDAPEPAACREECPPEGDLYEPWALCIEGDCGDACTQ